MERRNVKEANAARGIVYGVIEAHADAMFEGVGYEFVGMSSEGAILRDKENDTYVVLRAIAKSLDFDAEDAIAELEEKQAKAEEKKAKAAEKAAKAKAERAKKAKAKEEEEAE